MGDEASWRGLGLPKDLIRSAKADLPFSALLDAQSRIIDHMASDNDLRQTLSEITKLVETLAPPALCTLTPPLMWLKRASPAPVSASTLPSKSEYRHG